MGRPLGTHRSGGKRRWIDRGAVSEEEAEVVTGTAKATVTVEVTEAMNMTGEE